jgi:hypothetical protein
MDPTDMTSEVASEVVTADLVVSAPKIHVLVKRFQQFSRKTAEGVLEMGRAVHEARQLPRSEFFRFCELVQIKTSNIKKLAVIGAKYDYLIHRADKLPSNWTTVYAVAKLANEEIEKLIDQGVVNSLTDVHDLAAVLGKPSNPGKLTRLDTPTHWSFQVQLDPTQDPAMRHVLKNLLEQMRAMKMQVQVAAPLEGFLQAA